MRPGKQIQPAAVPQDDEARPEQPDEHQAAAVAARRRGTQPADVVDGLMARLGFRRVVLIRPESTA